MVNTKGRLRQTVNTKSRLRETRMMLGDNFKDLAEYMGISYQSLNKKLNGHVDFKRSEIKKIATRYSLDAEEIYYIFFDYIEPEREDEAMGQTRIEGV